MIRAQFDSIIFDLDGTLWDASAATAAGWIRVDGKLGLNTSVDEEAIRKVSGLPFDKCVEVIFGNESLSLQGLKAKLDQSEREEILSGKGRLYPGVQEGLRKLRSKYKLFLVSNCQDWYLNAFLDQSGLRDLFQDSLCFGQTQKPKVDNIRSIVERNNLEKAVYVGDTHWDQEAAYYAGVKFIFAEFGFGTSRVACPSVPSIDELVRLMLAPMKIPKINHRQVTENEFELAAQFYKSVGYIQSINSQDKFFGAFHDGQMIGLVRIAFENETFVLRGMQIKADYQFLGVGTKLIRLLEEHLGDQRCFCLPHGWLEKFYSQIGFRKVEASDFVPKFLVERLQENLKRYPHLILMVKEAVK